MTSARDFKALIIKKLAFLYEMIVHPVAGVQRNGDLSRQCLSG
jgi:hypothetical protein